MSFFFGTDLWDEMNRMQRQLEDLSSEMDYKRPRIEGTKGKKGKQCQCKAVSPFNADVFSPVTDLAENEHSYVVSMDLPGVKKDELNVTVHNVVLTVSGTRHHKFQSSDDENDDDEKEQPKTEEKPAAAAAAGESKKEEPKKEESKKEEPKKEESKKEESKKEESKKEEPKKEQKPKHKVIRMESFYGSFERSVSVPSGTTPDDVQAKFEDGVLTITIAKHPKESIKKIEIQ